MGKIIDITKNDPTTIREIICVKCLYRFISVGHVDLLLKNMECPGCAGVGFCVDTGQEVEEG